MTNASSVVITGSGAVCGGRHARRTTILDAVRDGPLGDRARSQQWDTTGWPCSIAAEIADFNPRALVDDRKLHKLIRRTDLFGLYARGTRDRARRASSRIATRSPRRRGRDYSDRTGVYVGSGGGNYENQYDYFPLMTEAGGDLRRASAASSRNTVNPMWLLRTLPNNVLCHVGIKHGLKGAERLHHQPQRRRHARGDRGDRSAAQRRGRPRGRGRATTRRSSRRWCSTTTGCGLLAGETLRPFDARARRQPVRRRRRRAGARDRSLGARRAARRCSAKSSAAATRARRRACSRSATTATASRARSAQALDDAKLAPGRRRHDRRARQRHAAVRRLGSRGDPARVRRRDAAGHRVQVGVRPPDRRRRHPRDRARARRARAQASCPASRRCATLDPACAGLPVSARAQAPRSEVALILCRGFAGTNAALRRPRARERCDARQPMADALAPADRCGIDTVEIARIERLLARDAGRATSRSSSPRRSSPTRRRARAAPRASPRASPRRKRASSCSRAKPRWRRSSPRDFSVARDNYGAPQVVLRAARAQALLGRHRIAPIALSLTHDRDERVGGRAGAAGDASTVPLAGRVLYRFLPFRRARHPRQPAPRVRRHASPTTEIERARAGALRAPVAARRASSSASAGCRRERKLALVRVENLDAFAAALRAGQGRADPHRPLRQLGSGDRRRHRQLSRRCAAASISCAARSSRAGSTRSSRGASTQAGFGVIGKRGSLDAMLDLLAARRRRSCSRSTSTRGRPTASTSSSSAIRPGRSRASRSSRSPPARRWCPRRAGASPTAATCCASRRRSPPVEAREHERGDPPHHARLQRRARAPGPARVPSSGTGCTGAGRLPRAKSGKRRAR